MKKVILLLLLSGFASISATSPVALQNADGPAITFEQVVIDMGNIKQNSEAICEFKFTNTGNSPLLIQSVVGQCGCTKPENVSKEPIAPGGKGSFRIKYDTSVRVGMFDKKIMVTTNASPTPVEVKIKGTVLPQG